MTLLRPKMSNARHPESASLLPHSDCVFAKRPWLGGTVHALMVSAEVVAKPLFLLNKQVLHGDQQKESSTADRADSRGAAL